MAADKIKIPADLLEIGMYVSELDRPWIESPFLFQGFLITNEEELDQLHQYCEYVYVDDKKSQAAIPLNVLTRLETVRKSEIMEDNKDKENPPYPKSFESEFPTARTVYADVHAQIRNLFRDIRVGRTVRTNEIKKSVTDIADSILRNPDAMLLMTNMKAVDEYMIVHAINVCVLSLIFARFMGLQRSSMQEIGLGALLHDVGEMRLPQDLLKKPGDYTPEEYATIQKHTAYGVAILKQSQGIPESAIDIALHHHERVDRSGYPDKLSGQEINRFTKIVGMIDVYDSLTSTTPYRANLSSTDVLRHMYHWRGTLFDEELVEKFIKCLGVYPVGSTLELSNGEIGIVISSPPENRLFPKLLLVRDGEQKFYDPPKVINLWRFRNNQDNLYEIKDIVRPENYGIDLKRYILRELAV